MKLQVLFTTQLKTALGRGRDEIELPGSPTVRDLLEHLGELHGDAFRQFVWDRPGELRQSMLICVGSECVGRDLTTVLSEGDEITLLSPVSGG